MGLFRNVEERRLRAGWRIAIQVLLMPILGVIPILFVAEPLTALHRRGLFLPHLGKPEYDLAINMIVGPLLAAAVVGSIALAARHVDHRPMASYGFRIDALWWRELAHGVLVGAVLMALLFAIESALGWITITRPVARVATLLALSYSAVKVLCVGVYEEAFCRGYLLKNLADGIGLPGAVALTSTLFALLHWTNENSSISSAAGLLINGLLFSAAFLATGRLSAAIGLHIAWNFVEGAILGFPVSGDKEPASIIGIVQRGPELFTGGAFGPEAGLLGVLASFAGIVWFCFVFRRRHAR